MMKAFLCPYRMLILFMIPASCLFGACSSGAPGANTGTDLTTYSGNGYSIGYPQGWNVQTNNGQVIFTNTTAEATFIINEATNPGERASASAAATGGINGLKGSVTHFQADQTAPTTMIGGTIWYQQEGTGDVAQNGQTINAKFVVLTTNYPSHSSATKLYVIVYDSPTATFNQTTTDAFQPMTQSFKFQNQ